MFWSATPAYLKQTTFYILSKLIVKYSYFVLALNIAIIASSGSAIRGSSGVMAIHNNVTEK